MIGLACDGGEERTRTARTDLDSGRMLASRYKIIEELGTGGMGRVYKAHDTRTDEAVAVKILHPEVLDNPEAVKQFCNELKLARKISHRNVCRMFDLQSEGRTLFLTMEYVDGEDLKATLERTGPLSSGKVLSLAVQICKGLREGHRLGVIHRDLKSRNIMLDKKGRAHILDYGIARGLSESPDAARTGSIVGTPGYIAPEQMEGMVDSRADIFSLGVILYEAASGFLPFSPDSPPHKSGKPVSLRKITPQFSEKLEKIIFRCLKPRPQERYQSADAVLDDLQVLEKSASVPEAAPLKKKISEIEKSKTLRQMLPVLRTMKRKKIFETLAAFIGGGWLILEFVHWILIDHYHLSEFILDITLISLIGAMIGTLIWRWHKAEQKNKIPAGAYIAIGIIAAFTILVNAAFIPHIFHSEESGHVRSAVPLSGRNIRLAVLPFEDDMMTGDNHPLCNAMTAEVISHLSSTQDIMVVPENDIKRYSGHDEYDVLAKKLGVRFILEPHFYKGGKEIRVHCNLYDSRHRSIIDSFNYKNSDYDDNSEYILKIQEQLSRDIANALQSKFTENIKTLRDTANLAAYESYWKGWEYEQKYRERDQEKDFFLSRDSYLKAAALDPDYAKAYWGLGNLYEARWVDTKAEEDFQNMVSNYETSFQKNPRSAEACVGLGWANFYMENWDKSCSYFQEALNIDPDNHDVHFHIGSFLRSAGLIKKAVKYYDRTIQLDPWHIRASYLRSYCCWYLGKYEKGLNSLKGALAIEPKDHRLLVFKALNLMGLGKLDEAEKAIISAEHTLGGPLHNQRVLLHVLNKEEQKALSLLKNEDINVVYQTYLSALLGNKAEVLKNIRKEAKANMKELTQYYYFYLLLKNNFIFNDLRKDPEFTNILHQQRQQYLFLKNKSKGI